MSVRIVTKIYCDGCGREEAGGHTGPRPDPTAARRVAGYFGWKRVRVGGTKRPGNARPICYRLEDRCPRCLPPPEPEDGWKEPEE